MNISIPEFSLVVMVGATSSGKSTLAGRIFGSSEIVASDQCRTMVADDPSDQTASREAFELVHFIARTRLKNRRLTVIDATNLQPEHRKELLNIARDNDCQTVAIAMNTPREVCVERNAAREDRQVHPGAVQRQCSMFRQNVRRLKKEGFNRVHVIDSQEEADTATITRARMRPDLREQKGPFDIIGDVHGCHDELMELLEKLGYSPGHGQERGPERGQERGPDEDLEHETPDSFPQHPEGRRALFLGDLTDRGPASDRVLETVMNMVEGGSALCVTGNHEHKLLRKMDGSPVTVSHGLTETLEQLERRTPEFQDRVRKFLTRLCPHYVLDGGGLAAAHAGIIAAYQGRVSGRVREFCMYGQTTGETDEWGLPVRHDWAQEYRGDALVVYGHTPVSEPGWFNNTINIDTGCVFGGRLTALRYPERDLVSVPAARMYYEPTKPPEEPRGGSRNGGSQDAERPNHALDINDVNGSRAIETETRGRISINTKQAAAALETMSRYALDPRWLVYMPPTISPTEASALPGILEHPAQAFAQYREDGMETVVCEEKHMGSRAILAIGRDEEEIRRKFGIGSPAGGACYTRTGRRFFMDPDMEREFLTRAREGIGKSGLWDELQTGWLLLDCEIMPWSFKAGGLLKRLYAPAGAAAVNTLDRTRKLLDQGRDRGLDTRELGRNAGERLSAVLEYRQAYRQYCWNVESMDEIRTAPFHLLAAQGQALTGKPHTWHMEMAQRLHQAAPEVFSETEYRTVHLDSSEHENEATQWWESMTAAGGEGMVVKPLEFVPRGKHGNVQPALKVRGPKYLSIIYGPEYNLPDNIDRMRRRSLGGKRSLALREFALGIEGLRRFTEDQPLHRVHECAFGVVALESEPTDPRL